MPHARSARGHPFRRAARSEIHGDRHASAGEARRKIRGQGARASKRLRKTDAFVDLEPGRTGKVGRAFGFCAIVDAAATSAGGGAPRSTVR